MLCNKKEINCLNRENCCLALFVLSLLSNFVILLSFLQLNLLYSEPASHYERECYSKWKKKARDK